MEAVVKAPNEDRPIDVLALPLTSLRFYSSDDDRLVHNALELATQDCMRERGFEYQISMFVARPLDTMMDYPFGPWTLEEVRDVGYDFLPAPRGDLAFDEFIASMSESELEAWGNALIGEPEAPVVAQLPDGRTVESGFTSSEGCGYRAASELFGEYADYEAMRQELDELREEAWDDALSHDAVEESLSKWRSCMGARGYEYENPDEPPLAFHSEDAGSEAHDDAPASSDELAVARADVECKAESGLHDNWFGVKQHAEQRLLEEVPEIAAAWQSVRDEALTRAQEIVARGGG